MWEVHAWKLSFDLCSFLLIVVLFWGDVTLKFSLLACVCVFVLNRGFCFVAVVGNLQKDRKVKSYTV